jgi:hypothetical protein
LRSCTKGVSIDERRLIETCTYVCLENFHVMGDYGIGQDGGRRDAEMGMGEKLCGMKGALYKIHYDSTLC